MIEVNNVSYKYKNGNEVLSDININIKEGEFVAIIGKNGSGKSTLTKLISGLEKPTKGSIIVNGINTKNKKEMLEIRKNVGIVFQNPENQIIFNKVYDDIAFGMRNIGVNTENEETIIKNSLEKVGMIDYLNVDSFDLSLGQKQRIAIASILALNTKIIVLDEPTTMLDPEGKESIYKIACKLKEQGYTIIYITNVIDEILLADRIIVLSKGKIEKEFYKKDILENIDTLKKLNIELPAILQITERLREKNVNIELQEFTMEELTEKILKLIGK